MLMISLSSLHLLKIPKNHLNDAFIVKTELKFCAMLLTRNVAFVNTPEFLREVKSIFPPTILHSKLNIGPTKA